MDSKEVGCEWLDDQLSSQVMAELAYEIQEDKVGFSFERITLVLAFLAFEEAFLPLSAIIYVQQANDVPLSSHPSRSSIPIHPLGE